MPYNTSNTNILVNVTLGGDVSGSLENMKVVSVENVKNGVLDVKNGGLSVSSIPQGTILIGNGENEPTFLSGTQNDLIVWSDGGWTSKEIDIISSMSLDIEENDIFQIENNSNGSNKKFYIKLKNFIFQIKKN